MSFHWHLLHFCVMKIWLCSFSLLKSGLMDTIWLNGPWNSISCRPLQLGNLQRNKKHFFFFFFFLKSLEFVNSLKLRCYFAEFVAVSSSALHWRTACRNAVLRELEAELEGICPNIPPREEKTGLPFLKECPEMWARNIIGLSGVFHEVKTNAFSSFISFPWYLEMENIS